MGLSRPWRGSAGQTRLVLVHLDDTGTGGIQRFARDLNGAAKAAHLSHQILTLGSFGGFGQTTARVRLALRLVRLLAGGPGLVIFSHINLAPLGLILGLMKRPYIVVLHGRESWRPPGRLRRLALLQANTIWSVSNYTKEQVILHTPRLASKEIRLVPLVVSSEFLGISSLDYSTSRVVAIARLVHSEAYKGVDTLIRAWPRVLERFPAARLSIVGSGNAEQYLRGLATDLEAASSIGFLGRVSDAELRDVLLQSSVFCLPGRLEYDESGLPLGEGFGIVFLEASAVGLPVIAGNAGGSREAVRHNITGMLVDGRRVGDVAAAIQELLQDEDLARRLGQAGRRWVKDRRSPEVLWSFLADEYQRILSSDSR